MKLIINEKQYVVSEDLIEQISKDFMERLLNIYGSLDPAIRMGAKAYARKKLYDLEKQFPNDSNSFRPAKGADPVPLYFQILSQIGKEGLQHAYINARANEESEPSVISSLTIGIEDKGQSGGQLVNTGEKGKREDVLQQKTISSPDKTIPNSQTINTRHKVKRL